MITKSDMQEEFGEEETVETKHISMKKKEELFMKQKKWLALLLAGTMIATTLLSGCGGDTKEDSSTKDSSTETSDAEESDSEESAGDESSASGETVTLWMHQGPAFIDATESLAESFKEETGISVDIQVIPYESLNQKIAAAFQAGNEPDIIQAFGSWLPTYINQGLFSAVPDDFAATFDEDFFAGSTEGLKVDGKYYGVPIELQCEYGLFYVPEKAEAAGVEGKPDSFEDIVKIGTESAVYNGDVQEYGGLEFDNYDNVAQMFFSWIIQQGGEYWDEAGTNLNLQTEEAQKSWQALVDLITVDKVTDTKHIAGDLGTDTYFFGQNAAQLVKGSWAGAYGDEFDFHDWEYTFMPAFEGDTPWFMAETGWTYVVSENSDSKDAAWKFVEYCLKPENAMYFNISTGTIPSLKAVAEDPEYTDAEANAPYKDQFQYLEYSFNVGPVQDMDYVKEVARNTLHAQVDGEYTTEEALEYMETSINEQSILC